MLTIEPRTFENTRDFPIDPLARYSLEHPVPCNAEADIFCRLFFRLQNSIPELMMTIGLVQCRRCQLSKCMQPPLVNVYHLTGLQYEDGGTITAKENSIGIMNVKGASEQSLATLAESTTTETYPICLQRPIASLLGHPGRVF